MGVHGASVEMGGGGGLMNYDELTVFSTKK